VSRRSGSGLLAGRAPGLGHRTNKLFFQTQCAAVVSSLNSTWLGGVRNGIQSRGRGFDSQSGRYHVVLLGWVTVCKHVNHLGKHITNTLVSSAFHTSSVGKSSTGLSCWVLGRACSPMTDGRSVWSHVAGDALYHCGGFLELYTVFALCIL